MWTITINFITFKFRSNSKLYINYYKKNTFYNLKIKSVYNNKNINPNTANDIVYKWKCMNLASDDKICKDNEGKELVIT